MLSMAESTRTCLFPLFDMCGELIVDIITIKDPIRDEWKNIEPKIQSGMNGKT